MCVRVRVYVCVCMYACIYMCMRMRACVYMCMCVLCDVAFSHRGQERLQREKVMFKTERGKVENHGNVWGTEETVSAKALRWDGAFYVPGAAGGQHVGTV